MLKINSSAYENMYAILNFLFIVFALLIIVLSAQQIKKWVCAFKIKKKAECVFSDKFKIKVSFFTLLSSVVYLFSQNAGVCISLVYVKRKHAKYHFESSGLIEIYVGNRETYRTGKVKYSIAKNPTWKKKGEIVLNNTEAKRSFVIFTSAPMDITSSDSSAPQYLGNGDVIFENITLYSAKHFLKHKSGSS